MIYLYAALYLVGMILFIRFAKRKWGWYILYDGGFDVLLTLIYPLPLLFWGLCLGLGFVIFAPPSRWLGRLIVNLSTSIWSITFGWALKEPNKDKG